PPLPPPAVLPPPAPPPLVAPRAVTTAPMQAAPVLEAPLPAPPVLPAPLLVAPVLAAPLLVDVTPLTLAVETVGGFCDPIIVRNTAVPCERTREFATAIDNQSSVRIRISQGESNTFGQNTVLGEVELSGLRPAPRGAVKIAVTFALDAD